jgi:HPt (histidine-containing phosphotransfer) domain-containing protein
VNEEVQKTIAQLVPAYLERRTADVQVLEQALKRDDLPAIQRIAHNMKGTGSGYGFTKITDIGARMEAAAKSGRYSEVGVCLSDLTDFLNSVNSAAGEKSR